MTNEVAALIERLRGITPEQYEQLKAERIIGISPRYQRAWGDALDAATESQRYELWKVVQSTVLNYSRGLSLSIVSGAALALIVRDLIPQEAFDILYSPWSKVMDGESK